MSQTAAQNRGVMKAWQLLEKFDLCRGALARDKDGCATDYMGSHAVSFCLRGLLSRTYYYVSMIAYGLAQQRLSFSVLNRYDCGIVELNDIVKISKPEAVALLKELDL